MDTEDLTLDEAMQDILAAFDLREVPEGYKTAREVWEASGRKMTQKYFSARLDTLAGDGKMDKITIRNICYYKAKS